MENRCLTASSTGAGTFAKGTLTILTANILNFLIGIATSIILARVLGPEGRGIYGLAMLLPSFIVTFGNFGIGPATVYYVARREFLLKEILGNNVLLSLGFGIIGIFAGLVLVLFFRETLFPGVLARYLFLAVPIIPLNLFFSYVYYLLLGAQRIKEFNYIQIAQSVLLLGFVVLTLLALSGGLIGAILAWLFTWLIVDALVLWQAKVVAGGIKFIPNKSYIKKATTYGIQAHISNILGFFNYRVDMLLVNGFLGTAAVGIYTVGVGMAERLWLFSQAASTVLLPLVAAETEEERRKEFTPLVARTVLELTTLGAMVLALLSRWIIFLFFGEEFMPAVGVLQALLIGIVALSAGLVLSNDISGRGFPNLNIYIGVASVATNVVLNILWIPRYGIIGAAWASTISYTISFFMALFFYCQLSGNRWTLVILPKLSDWVLYWKTTNTLYHWALAKVKVVLLGEMKS